MNRLNAEHLPPKLTQVVCCALTPTQRRMYEHVLKARDDELALRGTAKDTLGFIQRLQKVCNHPQVACEDASFNPLGAQLADLLPRDAHGAASGSKTRQRAFVYGPTARPLYGPSATVPGTSRAVGRLWVDLSTRAFDCPVYRTIIFADVRRALSGHCTVRPWP
ncbi:hypothetical protein M885DRAFT_495701 [Pelagophyceae sp. CCMP2097]|nr:hypothetical protein M885DRAFT_495701 [Pelagophyceae sp. CCMP2097]